MAFVLDASIALALVLPDESDSLETPVVDRLRTDDMLVPALWSCEVANALLMSARRGRIASSDLPFLASELSRLNVKAESSDLDLMMKLVLPLAEQHLLSTYDAAYLELARRERLPLATLDKALRAAARKAKVELL